MLNQVEQFSRRQQSYCSTAQITVDIVIPSKTIPSIYLLLEKCISSLRQSEQGIKFNVIVVESGPDFVCKGQDITIAYDRDEFNYNHALNQGLEKCSSDWVILANNDLIFHKNFMMEIMAANALYPEIKSFSPWNSMYNWHENLFPNPEKIEIGYRICHEVAGWCIIARREIFDVIRLSEAVSFWYSDNIYADALIENNILHALARDSKVDHMVSQTKQVSHEEAAESFRRYSLFREISCGHKQSDISIHRDS